MAKRIDLNELNSLVANGKKLFVKFSAEWCGQCKMASLLLDKVQLDYPDIEFVEVDVDDNELWDHETLKISVVPTFVGFKNRETIFNQPEYQVEDSLRQLLEQMK